ncbi:MAG: hypothetical protein H6650_18835 [Ardenticatenales bacterium]|nr:hypothetical protein [Ardenticatenales bacterium]
MIVINFTHPLTPDQQDQLARLAGRAIAEIRNIPCQFDNAQPFAIQVAARVDAAALTPRQWQTAPILINPPAYAPAAGILIAELHGRMGYFPALIRTRPLHGSTPPQFEIAEIINLQAIRDHARTRR